MIFWISRSYKSTITLDYRKEHTCGGCGAVYSYPFSRKITGSSRFAGRAQGLAQRDAAKELREGVDSVPCPTCGLYQPDMVAERRRTWFAPIFWLGTIALIALILLRCGIGPDTGTVMIGSIEALMLLGYVAVEFGNINRSPSSNARRVAKDVASGKVHHTAGQIGPPSPALAHPPRSIGEGLGLCFVLIGIGLTIWPEVVRTRSHWPLNTVCSPAVVGPGDRASIDMLDSINSIKGKWRGWPTATVVGDSGQKMDAVATANQHEADDHLLTDWGDTISVEDYEKQESSTPSVALTIPDGITGKTADCDITLEIDYPSYAGNSKFDVKHSTMNRRVTLQLASAHAGARYEALWWKGTLLGIALVILGGVVLKRATNTLRRRALPTRVLQGPGPAPVAAAPPMAPPPLRRPPPLAPPPLQGAPNSAGPPAVPPPLPPARRS